MRHAIKTFQPSVTKGVDVTSADMFCELTRKQGAPDLELHFAELKDPVRDKLRRFLMTDHLGERAIMIGRGSCMGIRSRRRSSASSRTAAMDAPSIGEGFPGSGSVRACEGGLAR
ncbi:hypothetical protein BZM26_32400 [Paraburkholderia strydomiana]|nr:hypothetical protein BZM26_32400 [Paraburkholderia strydomiana]